jgi:oligosaccharide repeat unit polymerase
MLIFFHLKIAYFFGDYEGLSYIIYFTSLFYFCLGFFTCFFIKKQQKKQKGLLIFFYKKDLLKYFVYFLILLSVIILILNYIMFGPPPLISFFTKKYIDYLHYGKLKNILFANAIFLFVISYFYKRRIISFLLKLFSISILLLYVSRGNIIFMFLFYIYYYLMNNSISNLKLFFYFIFSLIGVILLFQIIGEYRTGNNVFYNILEIKEQYRISNAGLIWIIAYLSMPFDNLLNFISHNLNYFGYGENIISRLLPAFMQFNHLSMNIYYNLLPNKYNTVGTYLSWIYFDFGILGILLFNFFIGIISGYVWFFLKSKRLFVSLLLTCLSLIFFSDYFFYFMTIILLIYSFIFENFIIKRFKYDFHNNSNI